MYLNQHLHEQLDLNRFSCNLELYVRVKFKDSKIFVGLCYKRTSNFFSMNNDSFFKTHSGILCITRSQDIFYKSMVKFYFKPLIIRTSLIKDNYFVFGDREYFSFLHNGLHNNISKETNLILECLKTIYKNRIFYYREKPNNLITRKNLPSIVCIYIFDFFKSLDTRKKFEMDHLDLFAG